MSINLQSLNMDDLLARLDTTEKHVTVLGSTTSEGWRRTVAWNPAEVLRVGGGANDELTQQIEDFVQRQSKAGRLSVGYLSYDLGAKLHDVELMASDDLGVPLFFMLGFDSWLTFEKNGSTVHSRDHEFENEIKNIMSRTARPLPDKLYRKPPSPTWSRRSYNAAYQKVHDYIQSGDVYQVNLTHQLQGATNERGLDLYRKISLSSQADFQAFIDGNDFEIISASPERFVKIADGQIVTSPIKGTRPRGINPSEDAKLRKDLETNPKELAELNMITDLMRNDLGKISEIGSVRVVEQRILRSYPTLWHAHSTIHGKLMGEVSPVAALISLMPGGSITGCPKKRAIEIIDEVEVKRRGVYTGSIFVIHPSGELDSNIAIRTMIKINKNVYLSVGGGIVYDSTQSDEYDETIQKAAVFLV